MWSLHRLISWGLRDYGTATWDGGDPACDHTKGSHHQLQGATSQRNGRANAEEQRVDLFTRTCARCGARRTDGQVGLEATPEEYVAKLVSVFREIRRVLRPDGIAWLNLGDCHATGAGKVGEHPGGGEQGSRWKNRGIHTPETSGLQSKRVVAMGPMTQPNRMPQVGLKPKDLVGIPWLVAFALRADGWWLRSDVVWSKPNPMPESVTDRPTRSHEYLFLLSKSGDTLLWRHRDTRLWTSEHPAHDYRWIHKETKEEVDTCPPGWVRGDKTWSRINLWRGFDYFYDADAIREEFLSGESDLRKMMRQEDRIGGKHKVLDDPLSKASMHTNVGRKRSVGNPEAAAVAMARLKTRENPRPGSRRQAPEPGQPNAFHPLGRNARTVWEIATTPYPDAHFATFPQELARRCILAGSRPGDLVLDPFAGAGTTILVADVLGRDAAGFELNPDYVIMARRRVEAPRTEAEAVRRTLEDAGQMSLLGET